MIMKAKEMKYALLLGLVLGCIGAPLSGAEVGPVYGRHRLIAGSGEAGFRDGSFIKAAFRQPTGLVVSKDGKTVFVADGGNHAVRAIHLDEQNRVSTECGDGVDGDIDSHGGTSNARLRLPTDLAISGDSSKLYIYDRMARKVKLWDRIGKTMSTLHYLSGVAEVANQSTGLLLSADETHLIFLDTMKGELVVGDLAANSFRVLCLDPLFKQAGARLAFSADRLRFVSVSTNAYYGVLADGIEVGNKSIQTLSPSAKVALVKKADTLAGIHGWAGMGDPPQHQGLIGWDEAFACFRMVENPRASFLGMGNVTGIPGPALETATSKTFLRAPITLGYDPVRFVIYACEKNGNRVMAVRDDSQGDLKHPLWFNRDYPKVKPVGVTRILMYGCSREFHSNEETPDMNNYISSQFEQELNLISSRQGTGQQYEVLHAFFRGRVIGAGEVFAMQHPEIPRAYDVDYVVFPMDVDSLWWDISSWNQVETKDDVPLTTQDAEWAAKSGKEKLAAVGPLTKAMIDFCRGNTACADKIVFDKQGMPTFGFAARTSMTFFAQPRLRELALGVEGKLAARLSAFCSSVGVKPVAFIMPTKEYLSGGGNDLTGYAFDAGLAKAHAEVLQANGIPAFEIIDSFRSIEPVLYPLFSALDGHYRNSGMRLVSRLLAEKFVQEVAKK